jgi:hypothetical protein
VARPIRMRPNEDSLDIWSLSLFSKFTKSWVRFEVIGCAPDLNLFDRTRLSP